MRAQTFLALLIFGVSAVFVAPAITTGQGGAFGKKGGGDPNQRFDFFARGQSFIVISNVPFGRDQMMQYAQEKGITNGQLSRAQYLDYNQEQTKARNANPISGGKNAFSQPGGPDMGGMKKKFGGDVAGFRPDATAAPVAPPNPDVLNQLADAQFKRMDVNGDGKLNEDEMPGPLRNGLSRWDKNGDNLIDQNEFREYFASRLGGGGGDNQGGTRGIASIIIEEEDLDKKTVVYRAGGKAPPGLPSWFKELDTDKDGQVSLPEWREGNKKLEEFKTWDLNDDGLITMEEAAKVSLAARGIASTPGSPSTSVSVSSDTAERPSFGGGKGKKGDRN